MDRVHSYLVLGDLESSSLPWELLKSTDHRLKETGAKNKAIEEYLGVYTDGTTVPLTLRQRFVFGTSLNKLVFKIAKVRKEAKVIIEDITAYKPWEADIKDTRLIRCFVLECLSPFKRFTLQATNEAYNEEVFEKVSWPVYIASWIFVTGALCFFIYWIFAWGVHSGSDVIKAWGIVFGTGTGNDVILVQVTKIFIIFYLPIIAMQGQLVRIRRVLADISLNYINRNDPSLSLADDYNCSTCNEICVIQHMSAACTASRSPELRTLPSAWLLRQVTTVPFRFVSVSLSLCPSHHIPLSLSLSLSLSFAPSHSPSLSPCPITL